MPFLCVNGIKETLPLIAQIFTDKIQLSALLLLCKNHGLAASLLASLKQVVNIQANAVHVAKQRSCQSVDFYHSKVHLIVSVKICEIRGKVFFVFC